ncbi:hypothetical protein KHP62_02865 [Rhodobacteraceae bacterium NNCM2]|nr:hypothetical protein [Coraliihabitans acroporae]
MRSERGLLLRAPLAGLGLAAAIAAGPATGAELDICYLGEVPEDAVPSGMEPGQTPFTMIGETLSALYLPRALCGFDVAADQRYWRSYVVANGCSPTSDMAGLVEEWLTEAPGAMQAEFDAARAAQPERVKKSAPVFRIA